MNPHKKTSINSKIRTPGPALIGRTDKTERLYLLEQERSEAIKNVAKELKLLWEKNLIRFADNELTGDVLWDAFIPQALFDTLDMFHGGLEAALAFVKFNGYKVVENELEQEKIPGGGA